MRHSFLLLAGCYGLAGGLWAQPIYNYTATSGSVYSDGFYTINASAPGFSLTMGADNGALPPRYSVGQQIPLTIPPQALAPDGAATVDFGGISTVVSFDMGDLRGFAQATASESSFTIPSDPTSYTFAARMTGQFTAYAYGIRDCGTDAKPPCDAVAVLSIDLPGTLNLTFSRLSPAPGSPYLLNATFASVPEPSSIGFGLLGTGIGGTVWLARRRKAGRSSC